jgi:hypothetical protein
MRRWLWLMGVFVWAGVLQAQDRTEVKPDGTRITTHQVPLLDQLPTACVALESKGGLATIVIPADELDRLATRDEKALEGKISRMDFLASGRARDLLKLLSTERDSRGCQEIRGRLIQKQTGSGSLLRLVGARRLMCWPDAGEPQGLGFDHGAEVVAAERALFWKVDADSRKVVVG